MTEIAETPMPGLGVRYTMSTRTDRAIGVVVHQTGRRDLVVYDDNDPDATAAAVELTEDEGRVLGELLGGSRIVERLADLPHELEGLAIDWVPVAAESEVAGQSLAESSLRLRTGASVVALVHGEHAIPAPGPDEQLVVGSIAVVVGTADGVAALTAILCPED